MGEKGAQFPPGPLINMAKKNNEPSAWEISLRREAEKRGVPFEQVALESIKYHKSLADQGVPGGQESYTFYEKLLLRIMGKKGPGGEKKD